MGSVGGLLGLSGGAAGSGFANPAQANITDPVTQAQINGANTNTQASLTGQQDLLSALQGQNGLANQSQVYNQQQGIVNGTGPNPAQAMLNQATGQNVANQAALMAGQRGAGTNVGLIARQAGQQGAGIQQGAVGQGATLQANQSLNALNNAANMANAQATNQIGQTNTNNQAQQAYLSSLLNAQQGFNNARVGSQGSVNAGNVNLANTTMGGQQAGIGGLFNSMGGLSNLFGGSGGGSGDFAGFGAEDSSALDSIANNGYAGGGMVGRKKYADGGAAFSTQPQSAFGQYLAAGAPPAPAPDQSQEMSQSNYGYNKPSGPKGGGSGMPMPSLSSLESAGNIVGNALSDSGSWLGDAASSIGGWLSGAGEAIGGALPEVVGGAADVVAPVGGATEGVAMGAATDAAPAAAANGGLVKALVSPGEKWLPPQAVEQVKRGANPMKVGKTIPGKPAVGGAKNSYKNDTVKANLDEGGIIVPRSATQCKNPERASSDFVHKVLAKRKVGK